MRGEKETSLITLTVFLIKPFVNYKKTQHAHTHAHTHTLFEIINMDYNYLIIMEQCSNTPHGRKILINQIY